MNLTGLIVFSCAANVLGAVLMILSTVTPRLYDKNGSVLSTVSRECGICGLVSAAVVLILSLGSRASSLLQAENLAPVRGSTHTQALLAGSICWALALAVSVILLPFQKTFPELQVVRSRNRRFALLTAAVHFALYFLMGM